MTEISSPAEPMEVSAVILAGGEGRRMQGRDKGLVEWQTRPLIEYALERLPVGLSSRVISCNRNISDYQQYANTVQDLHVEYLGPLAGVYAAMALADSRFLLVVPCDCPSLPRDLLSRLSRQMHKEQSDICYAHDGDRDQYLFTLIKVSLKDSLAIYLNKGGRSVNQWYRQHRCSVADCSDWKEEFCNINQLSDMSK
jgi:molybdopterin-guanine dinucleotide biosynthesis protein A